MTSDSRTVGGISERGNGYLRWILVQCANTAVHNAKDPYLSEFYWRLREKQNKEPKERSWRQRANCWCHWLRKNEPYDPAGVSA
jgi:transposase